MEKITWEKPSGVEVITNAEEATIKAALDAGWVQKEEKKTTVKKATVKK